MVRWDKISGMLVGGSESLSLSRFAFICILLLHVSFDLWSVKIYRFSFDAGSSNDSTNSVEYTEAQHYQNGID